MDKAVAKINGSEIQTIRIETQNYLNDKQVALLHLLQKCLSEKKTFDWDVMVDFYYKNVSEKYESWRYTGRNDRGEPMYNQIIVDIKESYNGKTVKWTYTIRALIRQWFSSNIGTMVLKGSILALPIIEIK